MGFFDVFKAKKKDDFDKETSAAWKEIFSTHIGRITAIQDNAAKYVVKERNWNIDFSGRYIAFGEDKYPIQFIGSESTSSNTWMWGWNNINGFSENLILLAKQTFSKGNDKGLAPLTTPQFALNTTFNGYTLSAVTCGLSKENYFYYRCPHSGGAAFVAVENAPKEVFEPVDTANFGKIIMRCIRMYDLDHKTFIESFLNWNKTEFEWLDNTLIAYFPQKLCVHFGMVQNDYRIIQITK